MTNRLSFASVLRGNHSTQSNFAPRQRPRTLSQYMQIYEQYGENYNYNISMDQSGSQSRRNITTEYADYQDYEEGVNPLDAWMSSQAILSKQNVNTQRKRNSPNNLIKLVNSKMDPRQSKNSSQKPISKVEIRKPQNNINMRELCRTYAEQKDSCQSSRRDPVWKFNSRQDSQNLESSEMRESIQNERQYESRKYMFDDRTGHNEREYEVKKYMFDQKPKEYDARNYMFEENPSQSEKQFGKYMFEEKEQSQEKLSEVKQDKLSQILKKIPVAQKEKKSLGPIVQEIKENLVSEIGMMAEQIVTNRKKEEDEEMLISQRSNTANERIENARKEIGQYLKIKQYVKKEEPVEQEPVVQQEPQQVHDGVGYSFSHEFNEASRKVEEKNRQSMLPNIEEVRSEQDYAEVHHEDINNDTDKKDEQIENEYIQKIQSVAYFDEKPIEQDQIKQSYRYSEPKHFQPPTIQLSLQQYVQQPVQKSEEEINPVCSKTKEEFQKMERINEYKDERIDEQVADSQMEEDQHSIVEQTIKIEKQEIPEVKESKQFCPQVEAQNLEINSVLHRPQPMNSVNMQTQKQQSFSVASSLQQQVNIPKFQPRLQVFPQEENVHVMKQSVKQPEIQQSLKESLKVVEEKTQTEVKSPQIKLQQKVQSKIEFRRIISPQQSIKEEKKTVPVPQTSIETKKQETEEKPKRLLKITLSPKYQQKVIQQEPATNPFTLQEKTEETKIPQTKIPQTKIHPIPTQKPTLEEERKENNQLLMNKSGNNAQLKSNKQNSSPATEHAPEVKSSIKISSYAMKESVRRQMEKKGSVKKSVRGQVSLKNSLVDDFQFDLDI